MVLCFVEPPLSASLFMFIHSFHPPYHPNTPTPPSPYQLYQHDKSLRKTDVTCSLPFQLHPPYPCLSKSFIFSFGCWESPELCVHLEDTQYVFLSIISPGSRSPSMTSIPRCQCCRMSRQRCVILGLENQSLATVKLYPALILLLLHVRVTVFR